jgi:tetratricopeptide (TPR) repeat protein
MVGENPSEICAEMKKICYERGAEDNLTAIVIRVSQAVEPLSTGNQFVPAIQETEEATVATARFSGNDDDSILEIDEAEIPTQNLVMPEKVDESKIPTSEYPTDSVAPNYEETSEEIMLVAPVQEEIPAVQTAEVAPQPLVITAQTIENEPELFKNVEPEKTGGGFFSKLLMSLLLLLIGAVLGAGGYYYWLETNKKPETPQIVQQSPNIPYTAYETLRREVDKAPEKFIERKDLKETAEEKYLLGRAYLLTGDFDNAKIAFEAAQKLIGDAEEVNQEVLKQDIKIGLSVIKHQANKTDFPRAANQSNSNTSSNANTNSASDNRPRSEGQSAPSRIY